jgi:hypothetical protein
MIIIFQYERIGYNNIFTNFHGSGFIDTIPRKWIAIGTGTYITIETADIVLVKNDPRNVLHIIRVSKSTYSKMYQNLLWATRYNIFSI